MNTGYKGFYTIVITVNNIIDVIDRCANDILSRKTFLKVIYEEMGLLLDCNIRLTRLSDQHKMVD